MYCILKNRVILFKSILTLENYSFEELLKQNPIKKIKYLIQAYLVAVFVIINVVKSIIVYGNRY